jgi:hypothetical protein
MTSRPLRTMALGLAVIVGTALPAAQAQDAVPAAISLPAQFGKIDTYFYKEIELPPGRVRHAWTAISALDFVLYVNGQEAARSRFGRVPSSFRVAEEAVDLAPLLRTGRNSLVIRSHLWSMGTRPTPATATARVQGEALLEGGRTVPICTDATWVGSFRAPETWTRADFRPEGWQAVQANSDPSARLGIRIPKHRKSQIMPDLPPPLGQAILAAMPLLADSSDWGQQVVYRDLAAETQRLLTIVPSVDLAQQYAKAICNPPTHMGDSYSITAYPIGNGWVWTAQGSYPFYNTGVVCGPEYQYPAQWNPGSTFAGDNLSITADGKPLDLRNQWMWKVRKTDVVVTAATDLKGEAVFYSVTLAPPDLKALVRIYAVANQSNSLLKNVKVTASIGRHPVKPDDPDGLRVKGKTLTESVTHGEMKAGAANKRAMIVGAVEEGAARASMSPDNSQGLLEVSLGDVAPGQCARQMTYRVFSLTMWDNQPAASDAPQTLAAVKAKNYGLFDETVRFWRQYNADTTHLDAPGPWGKRVADFIDDQKMLVQTQQFARTGAVGPMSFFSDEWIRDACGPIRSYLCTGRPDNARRAIDYFYIASVANRTVLNWVGMDVDITKDWPAVEDWSKISVHAGGGDHVSAEVPNWLILQHYWYLRYTGDLGPVARHWEYLKRLYYGQFDNAVDKIFRPDFKLPFHGDETYIYSGGEALWENRYDLRQNSYPGGNIYSADSSFEFVAAGDALVEMGRLIGKDVDAKAIASTNAKARALTEKYYWMPDLGFYAQGMSVVCDGQLNRYPMANINANVIWSGYGKPSDSKSVSNVERMMEYLMEECGVLNPIVGYDVTVGMLQGQGLRSLAAINHPWSEKAFYALLMIAGDTAEYSEWMAPGEDYRTVYRANRLRPWEGGINLDALLYYLSGMEPDAVHKRMVLTPRLPGGVYSPIRWETYTLRKLPAGANTYDLTVADAGRGKRTYALASTGKDTVAVTLNVLVPFAKITRIEVDGQSVDVNASEVDSQALAPVAATLAAGKTLSVVVDYQSLPAKPVKVDFKEFRPTEPKFGPSDIVLFGAGPPPQAGQKTLQAELSKTNNMVLAIDATLPTDPATFRAALLTPDGLNAKMLILGQGTMHNRKPAFWWDEQFGEVLGMFLRRGGVLLEANSGTTSSRHLAKALGEATFEVDYAATGFALAMDKADPGMDEKFRWVDETNVGQAGKWSAYWEGWYNMPYVAGGAIIKDHFFIWGEQEQPHAAMQFAMKAVPGKDHLVRIRTAPFPKKGFTLQVTEDSGATWTDLETSWAPQPRDNKNGWVDVFMTLPAKYIKEKTVLFRLKAPKGSFGGIGAEPERLASTGASRIWIRDSLVKPPSTAAIATASSSAGRLGLPDKGMVAYSQGRITFSGFAAPYRILGDSGSAAIIFKPIGKGLYVRSEVVVEESFSVEKMVKFVTTLLDPKARKDAVEAAGSQPGGRRGQ